MILGAGLTVGVIFLALVIAVAVGLVKIVEADREGLFPRNHIRQMEREDGGPGPIKEEERAQ